MCLHNAFLSGWRWIQLSSFKGIARGCMVCLIHPQRAGCCWWCCCARVRWTPFISLPGSSDGWVTTQWHPFVSRVKTHIQYLEISSLFLVRKLSCKSHCGITHTDTFTFNPRSIVSANDKDSIVAHIEKKTYWQKKPQQQHKNREREAINRLHLDFVYWNVDKTFKESSYKFGIGSRTAVGIPVFTRL